MDLRHWTHLRCEGRRSFAPRVVATCRRRVVHRFRSRGHHAVDSMDSTERSRAVLFSHGCLPSIKKRPTFSRGRFSYFIVSGSTGRSVSILLPGILPESSGGFLLPFRWKGRSGRCPLLWLGRRME